MNDAKARARATWNAGDYEPTSRQLDPAAIGLVGSIGVTRGAYVLDVAAGDGNCAIAAAERGGRVMATDFAEKMVSTGRARTETLGLDIEWEEADAEDLKFGDGTFDVVTSVFGAIFASDQEAAASELVRVLRPGGVLGLTAWTPDGFTGDLIELTRAFAPPSPDGAPTADPLRWGTKEGIAELLGGHTADLQVRHKKIVFSYSSWEEMARAQEAHGGAVLAKKMMTPEAYEGFRSAVLDIVRRYDRGRDGAVEYEGPYLEVVARKP